MGLVQRQNIKIKQIALVMKLGPTFDAVQAS